ncbi:hypothetical protein G3I24_34560, partial [Micromonospora aurantiaca]|nr:hypothetical protein [Micromonospora aurantiaca]
MPQIRSWLRSCAVTATAALCLSTLTAPTANAAAPDTAAALPAASTPLPAELEQIRATEATKLYGSPEERPMDE